MTTSPNGRLSFSKHLSTIPLPNMIQVQRTSYEEFLQMDLLPEERMHGGLQSVLSSIFPFTDFRETCELQFVRYEIGNWTCRCGRLEGLHHLRLTCEHCGASFRAGDPHEDKVVCPDCGKANKNRIEVCSICGTSVGLRQPFSAEECRERGMTYAVPVRLTFRLVTFDTEEDGSRQVRDVKEEELYFGELPLMTDTGTFIINGTERVIVSQLHRSPGVFFTLEGPNDYLAKVVPYRGSWIEFEYDNKQILWVRIDRKRRLPGTVFLRALSPELETNSQILRGFHTVFDVRLGSKKGSATLVLDSRILEIEAERQKALRFRKVAEPTLFAGLSLDKNMHKRLEKATIDKPAKVAVSSEDLIGAIVVDDLVDSETGEVIVAANSRVTDEVLAQAEEAGIKVVSLAFPDWDPVGEILHQTIEKDTATSQMGARMEIYRRQRPGDPPTEESATTLFNGLFFDERKYDLSRVGRFKFNAKLGLAKEPEQRTLDVDDFMNLVSYLLHLHRDIGRVDDIDSLSNRRVRTVGELMENQFRIGLVRMERAIKEKMSIHPDIDSAMPRDLVNSKPVMASVDEFFGSSQLSQFMDQTNPLSEVTHKRRLSALGPGGLSRERAGFEVRDVHSTHYGRICPIETPEGPNIGLISSLSCYARLNPMGYIESPYKKVEKGKVLEHVRITQVGDTSFELGQVALRKDFEKSNSSIRRAKGNKVESWGEPFAFYLPAWEEENLNIAQANAKVDEKGSLENDKVIARSGGEFLVLDRDQVDFIDVSPRQVVSVAASLIPFLEHDDANRALMGSNMQRQAVPLVRPEAPVVGTGMESVVAEDSGAVVVCRRAGVVDKVDCQRIIVRVEDDDETEGEFGADIYQLTKFRRSNQNTSINQKPLVEENQRVVKGQVLADGPNTDRGELALGYNVLVAFMPWYGHNFEDAIVISERLVKDDSYSSIHIQELELHVRDTKRGQEEITREIPNVSEEALVDLDERGIVRIGAHVKAGDVLVGKITPKGETELSPEEKLLTAIFGEKAKDVKDSSLKIPPGMEGVVIDVKIFSRIEDQVVEKDRGERIGEVRQLENEEKARVSAALFDEMGDLLKDQVVAVMLKNGTIEEYLKEGTKLTEAILADVNFAEVDLKTLRVNNKTVNENIRAAVDAANAERAKLEEKAEDQIDKILQPDELPPGVIQLVKVYLAEKRKIAVGDKMAGRHGNKGIIARIVPEEDMPFLPDGTPIDLVLNPLGVPSRMNVGQILETHLGWAARILGFKAETPVFQGAREDEVGVALTLASLQWAGQALHLKVMPPDLTPDVLRAALGDLSKAPAANGGRPDLTAAHLNRLGSRAVSQGTRDLYHGLRDFLVAAAKEVAGRQRAEVVLQQDYHTARLEAEKDELSKKELAALKAGLKESQKNGTLGDEDILKRLGWPALAMMLGPKSEADVEVAASELLRLADLTPGGKCRLRDGRSGELFKSEVTVGSIYMMKLSHLVDDKIHARSIGPYSLVTQQPLAGKAQFGGQRFGEMEVWALEAYGAAHTLQEMLTVKSDDVNGRSRVYEAVVKGQNLPEPGIPESFNVLVKELQALGLKVTLGVTDNGEE